MRRIALLSVLALAACSRAPDTQNNLAALDAALVGGNASDPALSAALRDQIMVDPALAQSSNANAVRPPSRPDPQAVPQDAGTGGGAVDGALTLGALAGRQSAPRTADCADGVGYSAGWANRLPADLPLYPDARVVEAAGADRAGCALRVVTFASSAALGKVVDWYYTRATTAGYSAGHKADGQQHVLAGTRGADAYVVYASPRPGGGTEVDLVVNAGS